MSVVGARPNFMKIAPFIQAIDRHNGAGGEQIDHVLVHTGQHYDDRMSASFFESLGIPAPDVNLEIGSGSHGVQLGQTMMAFEPVVVEHDPDWIVVVGDVNATLSCSVIAKRLKKKVAHIEAGLRSGDIGMPEEINRLVTDRLSDLLLTPDRISGENLAREGVPEERIRFVGNIMIDTLEKSREGAASGIVSEIIRANVIGGQPKKEISLADNTYGLMTMHRPSNVDHRPILTALMRFLMDEATQRLPLVWALHPRTRKQLQAFGLWDEVLSHPRLLLLEPIGYHAMLRLNMGAKIMLTDSGGLQEECCVLGTPCLTLRFNTERPITLREHGGASVLVGNDVEHIRRELDATLNLPNRPVSPEYWDGKTADRIVAAIMATTRQVVAA
ncbi:non-hydrolyzing UDP-N-acetylglucosamine 2-epimerase [Neolewinella aquimaris]|nr:UDP-N-acetylglucosamine 2-epimerase (non-hydrolyzing) [Neolewinella aquimaris]